MQKTQKRRLFKVGIGPGTYVIHPETRKLMRIDRGYPHMFKGPEDRDRPKCGEVENNYFG